MSEFYPQCSLTEREQFEAAMAYIEQYGEWVGNAMLGAVQAAMDDGDHSKLADFLAIAGRIDELNGGPTIVHKDPPTDRKFSN